MSKYDDFDDNDSFVTRLGSRFGVRHGVIALGVVIALGIGYVVLSNNESGGTSGNVPLIRADNTPYKVAPDEVGGMPVPNQNSTIFETLKGDGADKPRVENLLAEDEQPMTKAEIAPEEKPAEKAEAKPAEKSDDEKVAMIDPKSDTAKPEPMPSAPSGSDIANTEPSATDASEQIVTATAPDETPMMVTADEPKAVEPKKEVVKEEVKPAEPKKEISISGSAAIQFAAVKSDEEARKLWSSLQSKNPELQGKTLRVQKADLGSKGVFYRVQVAGLSADTASSICGSVKSRGGSCMVVK